VPQRPILVADDIQNESGSGRKRSEALREASSSLAWKLDTGIDLLYVEDLSAFPVARFGFDSRRLQDWHLENGKKLEDLCMNFPVAARGILKSGSPAEQILKAIGSKVHPELVAVGTRGEKGLKRLLLGSVAEEIIRHSKRPVMVIGPSAQKNHQSFRDQKPFKILVATDLSKNSRAAERYGLSLASRLGAKVVLLHGLWDKFRVVQQNALAYGMDLVKLDDMFLPIQKDAAESLRQKVALFKNRGVACTFRIQSEAVPPAEVILRESEQNCSIVLMGTHGRNILLSGFLGSTARKTILDAKIPVIIVRSGR
jgi:nucleotide-binding universal stress UspA family protein